MFKSKRHYQRIVFVTEDDPGPPTIVEQPDGTVQVDLRPRITVPRDSEEWHEVSCAAVFEMLARSPSFKYYPDISFSLDFIELTRDEFVKWLLVRRYEIPTFWGAGRRDDTIEASPPNLIEKSRAIGPAAELEQRLHQPQKAQATSGATARLPGGRRRHWRQDPVIAAIKEKWGSDWPPDTLSTPDAVRELVRELDRRGIKASPDTMKRAIGRRD
jgi:hypothetical protein